VKKAPIFAFLALLIAIVVGQATSGGVLFVASQVSATIVLDDLSISDSTVTQGETVSFSVTFENTGNAQTTATARVYIFDASNVLIDTINYTPTSIAPDQQKVQITGWNSNGYPVGAYVAKANVTFIPYNSSSEVSNELTLNFQIVGGGGGGGGGHDFDPFTPILPTTPIVLRPEIKPKVGGPVDFVRFPVLMEVVPGQSKIKSLQLINRHDEEQKVTMNLQGMTEDWMSVGSDETLVLPGETRNMDIAISIPRDAEVGDYLVRMEVENEKGKSSDFMTVRVRNAGGERPTPIVLKTIDVDRVNGKTMVNIELRNPTQKKIERIIYEEAVPEGLEDDQITFVNKLGKIKQVEGRKTLQWEVPELLSNERIEISYTIDGVLDEYSPYVNWYAYGLEISSRINLADVVQIIDLKSTTMEAGGTGQVTATVLYVGEEPMHVTMSLEAPAGFTVEPNYLTVNLQPRNTFTIRFDVGVPENVQESQLVRFLLYTDDGQVSARLPIVIMPTMTTPAQAAALTIKPMDVAIGGLLAIALIFAYMFYRRREEGGGVSFSKERLDYARSLKRLVKTE